MTHDPESFARTWNKSQPDAVERLRAALQQEREQRGTHAAWARLCEEAGQDNLALTEYQLALRDNPDDATVLERLSLLYRERGDMEKALACVERRSSLNPADAAALRELVGLYLENEMKERADEAIARADAEGMSGGVLASLKALIRSSSRTESPEDEEDKVASTLGVPSDADVARFAHLFAGRENVYARQWWDTSGEGGYTPVRQPMVFQVVRNHLLGSITIGVYPVRLDSSVTFFAIDLDINKGAIARARGSIQEARAIRDKVSVEARRFHSALAELGLPALLEDSGYKGRHIWVFLQEPVEASIVRQFGTHFLAAYPLRSADLHAEFFPKQSATGSGIGNLIKLPLGIHRRTGRRSRLLLPDGSVDPDPFATLRSIRKAPRQILFDVIVVIKTRKPAPVPEAAPPWDEGEQPKLPEVPKPPLPPPAWTAADFETNPDISHLIARCAVLSALKQKVEKHRRLSHDEQVVLTHSIGHSDAGVLAVNYLFDACVDVPAGVRLQTALSGNPISCPKIRKRIPHITGQVDCNCPFDFAPDTYPTPRLHLQTLPKQKVLAPKQAIGWDPVERTRALGVLRLRRGQMEHEIACLEKELLSYLESSGKDRIELEEGALLLKQEVGALPSLVWEPKSPETAPADKAEGV